MPTPRIFISYTEPDAGTAQAIALGLRQRGVAYFFDKEHGEPGELNETMIERGLGLTTHFLYVATRNSLRGWPRAEATAANEMAINGSLEFVPGLLGITRHDLPLLYRNWVPLLLDELEQALDRLAAQMMQGAACATQPSVPAYVGGSAMHMPPAPAIAAAPLVAIVEAAPGQFVWSGAVPVGDAGRLWDPSPPVTSMRINLRAVCPSALRDALLRLLCHVHPDALAIEIRDSSDWVVDCDKCLTEQLPFAHDEGALTNLRELSSSPAGPFGSEMTAEELAGQIEAALDERTMTMLDRGVQRFLRGQGTFHGCRFKIESGLAGILGAEWEAWKVGMDAPTRRHFYEMLTTFEDKRPPSQGGIGVGRQTVDSCLVPATILALAVAVCGDAIMHPQGNGPLKPHGVAPGNLASPSMRGHSSGVRQVKGAPIEHWIERLTHLPWHCHIVLLGGLQNSLSLSIVRQRAIGRLPTNGRLTDNSLARPIALAFDQTFAAALASGHEAVETHLRRVLRDMLEEQKNYLNALSPSTSTKPLAHEIS